jgi:hypothetical protein
MSVPWRNLKILMDRTSERPKRNGVHCRTMLALAMCGWLGQVHGQYWERTYGGLGSDRLAQVAALPNGNFVAVGSTGSFGPGGGDAYILLLADDGSIIRSQVLGGPGVDVARSAASNADGHVVAGTISDPNSGDYDLRLWGFDPAGELIWQQNYGTPSWDFGIGVVATGQGWTTLAHSYATGAGDLLIQRLGQNGEIQTSQTWGTGNDDVPTALAINSTEEMFVAGTRSDPLRKAAFILKFNSDLSEAWQVTLPSDSSETAQGVAVLSNGDLLLTGSTRDGSVHEQLYIARISASGSLLWKRVYGQADDLAGSNSIERPDGGLAVIGYTSAFGLGGQDAYLLLTDPDGWFQQGLTFGSTENEEGRSICMTSDGFLIGGTTYGYGPGPAAFHLIHTNFEGSTQGAQLNTVFDPVKIEEIQSNLFGIEPNPVPAGSSISIKMNCNERSTWSLIDQVGRIVHEGILDCTKKMIDIPQIQSGIYTLRTATEGRIRSVRLMVCSR